MNSQKNWIWIPLLFLISEVALARDLTVAANSTWQWVQTIGRTICLIGTGISGLGILFAENEQMKRIFIRSCVGCAVFFAAPSIVSMAQRLFGG